MATRNTTGNTEGTMDIETMKGITELYNRIRRHKLITKAIAKRCPKIGATSTEADPIVRFKLFDPCGSFTWYGTELDVETGEAFGWVDGPCPELGYFNVYEIGSVKGKLGIPMERDCWFSECRLSEIPGAPAPCKAEAPSMVLSAEEVIRASEIDDRPVIGPEDMSELTITETNNGRPMVLSVKTSAGWKVVETTAGEEIVICDVRRETKISETVTEYESDGETYRVIRL